MKSGILASLAALIVAGCSCENHTPTSASGETATSEDPTAPKPGDSAASKNEPAIPPVDGEVTLVAPLTVVGGANVSVTWTGPGNSSDYIDIVPRGATETSGEIAYSYVRDTHGTAIVRAPTVAGEYDIRYVLDMAGPRTVKAVSPLTVTAAEATLTAPGKVETGQAFDVVWSGPNGESDYIDIVKSGATATSGEITYAYTREGSPAKMEAPSAPGAYDVRYLLEGPGGRKVVAKTSLSVTQAQASLKAPASVAKGAHFKVEWTGPKSSGDYVDMVEKGVAATSAEKSYFYLTSTPELTAPDKAGEYDVRYILEAPGGRAVLARTTVSVR